LVAAQSRLGCHSGRSEETQRIIAEAEIHRLALDDKYSHGKYSPVTGPNSSFTGAKFKTQNRHGSRFSGSRFNGYCYSKRIGQL
jgi:hypothetical protein